MRTPAGFECPYFYGDYFRGRSQEECRLIGDVPPPHNWTPDTCKYCPVPGIQRANSCPNMKLEAEVKRPFFVLKRQVSVRAYCTKTQKNVKEPEIGCGQCHPLPDIFSEKGL
jgi:hypothetical protein